MGIDNSIASSLKAAKEALISPKVLVYYDPNSPLGLQLMPLLMGWVLYCHIC